MLQEALALIRSRYPSRFQPVGPLEPLGNAGGHSGAALWRYRALAGTLVLRAWPPEGMSAARLSTIHRWLGTACDLRFIPVPIAASDGESVQQPASRCWELAPWMPGAADLRSPPSESHLQLALEGLACFHVRLSPERVTEVSPGLNRCIRDLEELSGGGLDRLRAALSHAPEFEERTMGERWVSLARQAIPRVLPGLRDRAALRVSLQPCLRDARPEHLLFEGDALSGLVDFGAMGIETVAADLARLLGEWLPESPSLRATALWAYQRIRPLGESETALIASLETAADVLIAGHWLRWRLIEKRTFEDPEAVTRGIARGLDRLERLTGWLDASGSARGLEPGPTYRPRENPQPLA
jgi:homoserine kinase type II